METIIASGPIIIKAGKLLVSKDQKDDFYKVPGGTLKPEESLEDCCKREAKEEVSAEITLLRSLNPMILWKNPRTKEEMIIVLIHYLAELKGENLKPGKGITEITWLDIQEIKEGKHNVAQNIKFLIEKGDIK